MKKFNLGMLGLLAIPLAGLGIVGSVAFAQSNTPTTTPAAQTVQQVTTDKEVPDAQEIGNQAEGQNEQVDQAERAL